MATLPRKTAATYKDTHERNPSLAFSSTHSQVATVSWIRSSHHVLSIEHLLGQLGNGDGTVLLASPGGERSETSHEEVETGEGNYDKHDISNERAEMKDVTYPC